MTAFPYTLTPSAFAQFLEKLKDVGVPAKIDRTYLSQIGFASANHRPFIPILKHVDLLDASGKPTDRYRRGLRGGDAGKALVADGIRQGYSTLFETYTDANARTTAELSTFIKTHSDLGDRALQSAVSTFQTLCKFGSFDTPSTPPETVEEQPQETPVKNSPPAREKPEPSSGGAVTINVNIALSVDATSDPAVYDAFFAAMAKHLKVLDGGSSNSA
jgi:hypothetical protein